MARNANDLLADLDQLGVEEKSGSQPKSSKTTPKPAKDSSNKPSSNDDDPFGDLQAQLAAKAQPTSRPATPRMSSSATSANNKSPKRAEHTPASSGPPSGRTSSEDKIRSNTSAAPVRKSGESARGYHQGVTPNDNSEEKPAQPENSKAQTSPAPASGGGWWGSMYSAATAAVKQAETLAKEISGNEEAQRWAGQVRAIGGKNLTNLQHLSTDLRSRALPTFTTLLQHIAPPISAHERLQIHTTHDILNYPGLDPLIYQVFSRTMSQVEGGDLMVIQRGTEQRSRASASADDPQGYRGGVLGSSSGGWSDGPWWREGGVTRSLGTVPGLKEGSRLARVGAEAYAREFFDAKGGVEEAAKAATQTLSETNPVRSSDIFLAIQAISYEDDEALFVDDGRKSEGAAGGREGGVAEPAPEKAESVVFAVYLHDPIHSLSFSTLSQPFPAKWASWLDASAGESESGLPDSIQEIIAAGGLDPREWVAEWMEETLSLAVGVVAQRYVARRMGVGEGGLGRGKKRVEEEGMGGEAARAI